MSILRAIVGVAVCFTVTSGNGMRFEASENDDSRGSSLLTTRNFSSVSSSESKIQKSGKSQKTFADTSETNTMIAEREFSCFLKQHPVKDKQHPVKDIRFFAASIEKNSRDCFILSKFRK
jgi:hypothetical protein